MRAAYLADLEIQDSYLLTGDLLHHLVMVTRIEKNEELLLLNGKGLSIRTVVEEASKKTLRLKKLSESISQRDLVYDLAVGIPKKEALELSLKQAVELGFRRIFLVRGQYSQTKIPDRERVDAVLVSALEQSNCSFLPEVVEADWESLPWNDYGTVLLLDSQNEKSESTLKKSSVNLLVVGPEGGFSPDELRFLRMRPGVESILLPTPILRTPTAVAAGAGLLLQRLMS